MTQALTLEHITEMMGELRAYQGRTVVLKIGGNAIAEDELFLSKVARQINFMHANGIRVLLVHGGGPQIDDALRDAKIVTTKGKDGRRITSPEAMDVVAVVMKKMNEDVGKALRGEGCDDAALFLAASLSTPLVTAESLDPMDPHNNRSGKPITVNAALIDEALDAQKIVILHSLGLGENKTLYNINGDDYAMAIAIAIKAKRLILITNVEGVLDQNHKRIPSIERVTAKQLIDKGVITGGMIPKVESALWVVEQGVGGVAIIDGFRPWAILAELLTHQGLGTLFYASAS